MKFSFKAFKRTAGRILRPVKKLLSAVGIAVLCVIMVVVITGTIVASAATVFVVNLMDDTSEVTLDNISSSYTTYIYAKQGNDWLIYDMISNEGEKRIWCSLEQIPQYVRDAVIYSEDERFNSHDGVDFFGIAVAFSELVTGEGRRGASTITQQTIKNITGDDDVDGIAGYERKIREIYRAVQLEKEYSKDDILEAYLNLVPLDQNIYGIQAAANYYFNKDVSQLTIGEAAAIAAIIKSPYNNNPMRYPENNYERRKYILDKMLENGAISSEEYDEAVNQELNLIGSMMYTLTDEDTKIDASYLSAYDNFDTASSYYVDAVIYQATEIFMDYYGLSWDEAYQKLRRGGYRIYTCVDLDIQKQLEEKYLDLFTFSEDGSEDIPQSACICMDYNGRILGVVGGIGEKDSPLCLNRATMSTRQPGSSIKPLSAYSLAVDRDLVTWSTQFLDVPLLIKSGESYLEWPRNYSTSGSYSSSWSKEYNFTYSCLQRSLNTNAAQLVEMLTPSECFEFLYYRLKLDSLVLYKNGRTDIDRSPMSVGALTDGVTLEDIVSCYQMFGNGGKHYESTFISRILDSSGEVVFQHSLLGEQVIDESTAYVMNRMLETVVSSSRGTGRLARLDGVELIAKTGTTQDWCDLWFIGCTPEYVTGLWIGHDIPVEIDTDSCYGSPTMWKNIFGDILEAGEVKTFTASNFVVEREFCMETGLIAGSNCQDTSVGYYKKTNIPPTCSGEHLKTEIDTMLEGLGRRDVAVIVTEGIDIADYEAVTGHKYTYINELIRSYR
ncbi:MAG TPA: penicillin-binding protein [Candidatus Faeciplasma avium]|uniref:Penicillin-binding protein 1A n=1 Tax=Candidatus Faeciplasma avium TaxID=2840798 RepID=A0A9D1NR71_9FIRM|nr:penicillin-binding protein [Candidatus Faeciplasma avium]